MTISRGWTPVIAVARSAEIRTRSGHVRRLDLADLENGDAVRAALDNARARLATIAVGEHAPAAAPPPA